MQNVYLLEQGAAQIRAERLAEAAKRRMIATACSAQRRQFAWQGLAGMLAALARWPARPAVAARRCAVMELTAMRRRRHWSLLLVRPCPGHGSPDRDGPRW